MRRTHWWAPDGRHDDQPHPLLRVLNRIGPRTPDTVVAQPAEPAEQARRHWQGTVHDGFRLYGASRPAVTGMRPLKEQDQDASEQRAGCTRPSRFRS